MINITPTQIALTVILSILGLGILFFALVIFVRVKVTLKIKDELRLFISFLGIRFNILPRKKKKYRLADYTLKKIRERERKQSEKDRRRAQRKAEREAKRRAKREAKKKASQGKAVQKPKDKKIPEKIDLFIELLKLAPKTALARFHFHIAKLHITVGSEDAAKTAITYGAICGVLYPLLEFLDRHSNLHKNRADIFVGVDYTAEKIKFEGDIAFSISIFGLLAIIFKLLLKFISGWTTIQSDSEPQAAIQSEQKQAVNN